MSDIFRKRTLGQTGLQVGPLGLAGSYGAPAKAFEFAFDKGCNYFYWGSGRRRDGMRKAIKNLCSSGKRDEMVIAVQTYARFGIATEFFFQKTLKSLKIDYADLIILGWHNKKPADNLIECAQRLKNKGLVRYIGMSGHNRSLFPEMMKNKIFDIFHIRYNAAHRGAEKDIFPFLPQDDTSPGIVTYTATRWGQLLNPKKIPKGETPLKANQCYRFSLSNENVNVCLCGPKDMNQMEEALLTIEKGPLKKDEYEKALKIGDHIHSKGAFIF